MAGLTLGDQGLAGRDPDVLRPAGHQLEVLAGAGREERDLLEVVDECIATSHGAGNLTTRALPVTLPFPQAGRPLGTTRRFLARPGI